MAVEDLFVEAERQLTICNACRYCAGYCPVWPALELRTELTQGDITHLSNLCHDCRDCFTACMYTAPHEFDLNPPKIFTQVREETYANYVWPRFEAGRMRGRGGLLLGFLAACLVLVGLSVLTTGGAVFAGPEIGSPYELFDHRLMLLVIMVPSLWVVAIMVRALFLYWRDTHGPLKDLLSYKAWERTLEQAATLRHQTGGEEGCAYEENEPSAKRRWAHQLVLYGFVLTFVSTTSAGILQNVLGQYPPYPYFSVPVVTGTVGGVLATIGCVILLRLKTRADAFQTTPSMSRADRGLIWALLILMVSGLVVLGTRTVVLFAPVLVLHLAAVIMAYVLAPYTKFFHWTYRVLAMYKDNLERLQRERAAAAA